MMTTRSTTYSVLDLENKKQLLKRKHASIATSTTSENQISEQTYSITDDESEIICESSLHEFVSTEAGEQRCHKRTKN
jgi:hypothetical protein